MAKARTSGTRVRVVQLPHAAGLPLPAHQTEHSAGLDLIAAVDEDAPIFIPAGGHALIPTGLQLELPTGTEGQVRPRSGLAMKHGVTVLNSPGTIDADYRGEVKVLLINLGKVPFTIVRGERIAQLVVATYTRVHMVLVSHLKATTRGAGGFGSTGLQSKEPAVRAPHKKRKRVQVRAGSAQRRPRKTRPIR